MADSIVIVGGCGHVGLPLGIAFAQAGASVTLMDVDEKRAAQVAAGSMPFIEYGSDEALPAVLATGRLKVTLSPDAIGEAATVIVTIGTPVDEYLDPGVRAFDQGIDRVLDHMHDNQLLVMRSTVFPGVTERLARRVAARRLRLPLAYCPERIAQAYALEEIRRLPQLVGGVTPEAAARATALFRLLGVKIIQVSPTEAELAKLFANAYRYINFAIANQFYLIAQNFGASFDRIHHAVTADYPRMASFAKAGFAGGPCLLKDTMQLAAFNHNAFALGQAAMMVNEGLPRALVDAAKARHGLAGKTAAILGMAFKGNCDDPRSSLSYKLRKVLTLECRRVLCTDPYIEEPDFVSLETALAEADVIFVGACHDAYRKLVITKPVVDVFGFLPVTPAGAEVRRAA